MQKSKRGEDGCCDGYMFNDTLAECTACKPGYFGVNCSMSCPPKLYGLRCQLRCNCSEDECDLVLGCAKDNGECTACKPGYFGVNCSMSCPPKLYGLRCQLRCNCSEDECDLVLGCVKDNATNTVPVYRTSPQTTVREQRREISAYSLMAKVLIGHVILLGFVIMAHAAFSIIKRYLQ
uniref:Cell death abnormality protein 1-like n=1 Tax=Crassostrea virginica TaxID=6565 RepID=A0A8B8AGW9_CRAVI|nr:cell death abnormality protein 1-like [Crassostrea virginica]